MTGSKSASDLPALRGRVRLAGVAAALAMATALALFTGPLFPEPLFDRYQRWAPRAIPATRVHLVRIDAESLRALGPWPWPRSYLARLTDRLREAGAAAVGFDIVFAEADPTAPARLAEAFPGLSPGAIAEIGRLEPLDEQFGRAVGKLPVVVARTGLNAGSVEAQAVTAQSSAGLTVEARFAAPLPAGAAHFPLALGNVDALEFVARGQGLIGSEPDGDGVTRKVRMAATIAGQATPGLALDLARLAEKIPMITPVVDAGGLRALVLGRHRIPVDRAGSARLWFGTLRGDAETSAVNIIRRPPRPGRLAGKIVIVGPASVGLGDVRSTPLGRTEFGLRFHALALDAILADAWLERPPWAPAVEWGLGLVIAGLAVWQLPRLRRRAARIAPVAVITLTFMASWAGFAAGHLLLDPLRPLLIGGSAAVAIAAMLFAETGRRARLLRDATLAQEGEMNAARTIQMAMLPDRAALAGLDPRLDLDAVLEPAQAIGGDLYDAFALPDGRIVFLVGDVTGKGPAAALFMAVSKALAHSLLRRGGVPLDAVIMALNDELAGDGDTGVEVTLLCGIIDLANGRLDLVNAGHENPLIVRADGAIEDVAMEGGLPLCTLPGMPYPLEHAALAPGDALVIITDGVREAQDGTGDFFGSARTRTALAAWRPDEPAAAATAALVRAVRRFEAGTPASDDLTVMALRYRANE